MTNICPFMHFCQSKQSQWDKTKKQQMFHSANKDSKKCSANQCHCNLFLWRNAKCFLLPFHTVWGVSHKCVHAVLLWGTEHNFVSGGTLQIWVNYSLVETINFSPITLAGRQQICLCGLPKISQIQTYFPDFKMVTIVQMKLSQTHSKPTSTHQ